MALGVIPARLGSTRLPRKALLEVEGRPLIAWVVQAALAARELERVLVATDDEAIAAAARDAGVEACLTRADHPSGTDRIAEAIQAVEGALIVNIQGDEPEIEAQ
ncbi:MAG: NTP transferase domain-containing protein, partial [Planctomycetes bacterium]|nr:NTP transferase domain-containing protein [Planctomycetota bacterium]